MPTVDAAPLGACGHGAETHYLRHATQVEYDAIPEGLKPIDGYAVINVPCCGDCHPGQICDHPDPGPAPCPACHAQPGRPCTKPDGSLRPVEHPQRAAAQPEPQFCRHAHRETCTDPRHCQCTGDDPAPQRLPRTFRPPTGIEQATALGFPPDMIPVAAHWLQDHGINPAFVRGQIRSGYTQDNQPAMLFDYVIAPDDGHGREVTELRVVPVDIPAPH